MKYTKPEYIYVEIEVEDIITTSGEPYSMDTTGTTETGEPAASVVSDVSNLL